MRLAAVDNGNQNSCTADTLLLVRCNGQYSYRMATGKHPQISLCTYHVAGTKADKFRTLGVTQSTSTITATITDPPPPKHHIKQPFHN
jgi:hypothetical protein